MSDSRYQELHEFMKEQARDAYRAGFHYEGETWDTLYVRSDLATEELRRNIPEVRRELIERGALLSEEKYPPIGETHATTEVHENAVIMHFPEGPREGTVLSLDREVTQQITEFVLRCRNILSPGQRRDESDVEL